MSKLKDQLIALAKKILGVEKAQKVAGNRWKANHDRAVHNHQEQKRAERLAKKYRSEGHIQRAVGEESKAARCRTRAWRNHKRALYWVDKAKKLAQELHNLHERQDIKEKKLRKLEAEHGPRVSPENPNKVIGGDPKARLEFAMDRSQQTGSQYYSQSGPTTVKQGLTGPTRGHRHDCSSWFTSMYWTCDLPDPNGGPEYIEGETTFTGTLGEGGKTINESELDTGDAILYGTAPFHHVEMKDGPMSEGPWTVGHGSDPIDRGVVALLPGPRAYRRYAKK